MSYRNHTGNKLSRAIWLSILLGVATCSVRAQANEAADVVLENGAVYTVDAARSWAEAVAIKDKKIIYVGSNNGVKKFVSYTTRVIGLQGKMVLPGFHDSHVHPVSGGMLLSQCSLSSSKDLAEALEAVRVCRERNPPGSHLPGGGWELPLFKDASPTKELLDKVAPDIPVYLESADGHSAWVNSKALTLAGVGKKTSDPTNGRIERDARTGEPSGTLPQSESVTHANRR